MEVETAKAVIKSAPTLARSKIAAETATSIKKDTTINL